MLRKVTLSQGVDMRYISMLALALIALALPAHADDRLGNKSIGELKEYTASPASGDMTYFYDASANRFYKRDATKYYPTTYAATLTGNPMVQGTYQNVTLASLNAGQTILTGVTGKYIKPRHWQVYSSGSLATCTAAVLECSSGPDIASINRTVLTDGAVIGPYSSGVTLSSQAVNGCPSGDSVKVAKTGSSCATSSNVYVNMEYTWQ